MTSRFCRKFASDSGYHMKKLSLMIASCILLTGCASQSYYEEQPFRDDAETERVAAVGQGLKEIVAAFRVAERVNQDQINPFATSQAMTKSPCYNCGGPSVPLPSTEATVFLSHDKDWGIVPSAIQFNDASKIEAVCSQESPCIEPGVEHDSDGLYLQAPVQGTGQAINIYNQPPALDHGNIMSPVAYQGSNQERPESILLKYIMMEKAAAAKRVAAAEETRQLELIMSAYTAAVMKKQPKQAAPYTPESTLNKIAENIPFVAAIWGMNSLGRAGIKGAQGDTTATLSGGSSVAQEGAEATALNTTTTTEVSEIINAEE